MSDEVKVMNADETWDIPVIDEIMKQCPMPAPGETINLAEMKSDPWARDLNAALEAAKVTAQDNTVPIPRQRQDELRLRIVYVREDLIVSLLNAGRAGEPGMIAVPDFPELPEGFVVERATHCWDRRAFALMISHPSFDVVPDGIPPPDWPGWRQSAMRTVRVVDPGSEK